MACNAQERPVLSGYDEQSKTLYLYMTRCNKWGCPYCGHVNRRSWVARISTGIDYYQRRDITDWMFCTLTSHPKLKTKNQCLYVEPRAWKKLWSRIHYHHGDVKYAYIPELHKNGRVHWHMLMSGGIPIWWWKRHAPKCGFGYMVDSQPVRDGQDSVMYVTKELSKQLGRRHWPAHLRRIRTNQNWPQNITGDDFSDFTLDWVYLTSTCHEKLESLRRETERTLGIRTTILGTEH